VKKALRLRVDPSSAKNPAADHWIVRAYTEVEVKKSPCQAPIWFTFDLPSSTLVLRSNLLPVLQHFLSLEKKSNRILAKEIKSLILPNI
jgi:hypothetical protein